MLLHCKITKRGKNHLGIQEFTSFLYATNHFFPLDHRKNKRIPEELIKKGAVSEAQNRLDDINDRNAEWHYLQSVVFYKKNWINESKKQLEIALSMEPHNEKYADAYTKLKQKMNYNENQFRSGNVNGAENTERQMGGNAANDCLSFCVTWCCINAMCNMCCR